MPTPSPTLLPSSTLLPGLDGSELHEVPSNLVQTQSALADLSGVVLDQSASPSSFSSLLDAAFHFQEFYLPSDFVRGTDSEARRPDLTGFQFLTTVSGTSSAVVMEYTCDLYVIGRGWENQTTGTVVGSHSDGRIWMDVYFEEAVEITDANLNDLYRIGVRDVSGLSAWWYKSPNPLSLVGGRALVGTTPITDTSFCFRILASVADQGVDFLGNPYRSIVAKNQAENVSTVDGALVDKFWLSKPNPSKFAVECLYFDVRDADEKATVVDDILIDPMTPGAYFTVYYTSEGDPGTTTEEWEGKLWDRVPRSFRMTRREHHSLPEPVTAKFLCIEFSHLQAQNYSPGPFVRPMVYKKHPKWVLDYFLLEAELSKTEEDPFIATKIQVTYDALDFAYIYYLDDLKQQALYPGDTIHQPESIESFFLDRTDTSDLVDTATLDRINLTLNPYKNHPGINTKLFSILGQHATALAQGTGLSTYPVENLTVATKADNRLTSSTDRGAILTEQGYPVMYFYVQCRHTYRVVEASFEFDRAYFVGVREIAFTRQHYFVAHDNDLYVESTGDETNVLVNDFSQVENTWMVYDANG